MELFECNPRSRHNRLEAIEVIYLTKIIKQLSKEPIKESPFDGGWLVGWMGCPINNPWGDGSVEEIQWLNGLRQGKLDRVEDDDLPIIEEELKKRKKYRQ